MEWTPTIAYEFTELIRMKVTAFLPTYRPRDYPGSIGGGEISNRILLEGLAACGHKVMVLCFNSGGMRDRTIKGVRVFEMSGSRFGGAIDWFRRRLLFRHVADKLLEKTPPDVLLATTDTVSTSVALAARHNIPLAVFIRAYENLELNHGNLRDPLIYPKVLIKRTLLGPNDINSLANADLLLPNSVYMQKICNDRVNESRSKVIYPPLKISYREQLSPSCIETASMVGTSSKKGVSLVVNLSKIMPELKFRILGCPGLLAGQEIVERNLIQVGWCDTQEEFCDRADIVLVPSLWNEPFGRVAIEALLANKIPFVADIGGLPEAVAYERDLIIPPNDCGAWLIRLKDAIRNRKRYQAAAARARAGIRQFEVNVQVANLAEALQDMQRHHSGEG